MSGPVSARAEPRLDVRLVPSAVAAWGATGVGVLAGWQVAAVLAAGSVAAVALVLVRHRDRGWAAGMLAVLAVLGCFSVATALRAHAVATHPLAGADGARELLEVVLTDDPKALRGAAVPGMPARVLVRADLVSSGQYPQLGGAVVLLAPAEGWAGLLPGQHLRVRGRVQPPQRNDLTVAAVAVDDPPQLLGAPSPPQLAAGSLRTGLRAGAARTLGQDPAGLLPGLVVGDTSALSDDLVEDFKVAGLTHLTAVSGTNITIVLGAVLLLVRLVGVGPRPAAVLAGLALVGFVVLARPSPSVLRAAVMGTVALLALVTGRRKQALPALGAAVLVLLAAQPALAVDAGFALSVLATGALVLLAPRWVHALRVRGVPAGVAELLAVPAAAHVATAPVVAGLSAQLSLVAVLANLLAAPAVGVATVLGVLATVVLPVSTPLGEVVLRLAEPPVWWLVQVGRRAAAVPGAAVTVPGGVAGALGMAAVTVAVLVATRNAAVRGAALAMVVGVGLVWVPTRVITPGWPATGWAMVTCDVGQGEAMALAAGAGRAVVVDTGPDPAAVDGCLDRLGVTEVPLVVLTHLHADHVDGLDGVLAGRRVGAVALGPLREPDDALRRVRDLTAARGVPLVDLVAGQQLQWPELTLDVLGPTRPPPRQLTAGTESQVNEFSLVMAAQTALGRVLLSGEAGLGSQAALLAGGLELRADVLTVPHHGSRFSRSEFFDAVAARVAVISVGAGNSYGHPNPAVLDHLLGAGVVVERTDQAGDVALLPGAGGPVVVERGDPRPPP